MRLQPDSSRRWPRFSSIYFNCMQSVCSVQFVVDDDDDGGNNVMRRRLRYDGMAGPPVCLAASKQGQFNSFLTAAVRL